MHKFWKAQLQIWHHQKENNAVSDGYWLDIREGVDSYHAEVFQFFVSKSSIYQWQIARLPPNIYCLDLVDRIYTFQKIKH